MSRCYKCYYKIFHNFFVYFRSELADCRSLPTLETAMQAFGIKSVFGNAFEKLRAFLEDLEGREESDALLELLRSLMFTNWTLVVKFKQLISLF